MRYGAATVRGNDQDQTPNADGHSIRHHPVTVCSTRAGACPFHSPSDHLLAALPFGDLQYDVTLLETDVDGYVTGEDIEDGYGPTSVAIVTRRCSHGYDHPDPDSVDYLLDDILGGHASRQLCDYEIQHDCDGCCLPPEEADVRTAQLTAQHLLDSLQ